MEGEDYADQIKNGIEDILKLHPNNVDALRECRMLLNSTIKKLYELKLIDWPQEFKLDEVWMLWTNACLKCKNSSALVYEALTQKYYILMQGTYVQIAIAYIYAIINEGHYDDAIKFLNELEPHVSKCDSGFKREQIVEAAFESMWEKKQFDKAIEATKALTDFDMTQKLFYKLCSINKITSIEDYNTIIKLYNNLKVTAFVSNLYPRFERPDMPKDYYKNIALDYIISLVKNSNSQQIISALKTRFIDNEDIQNIPNIPDIPDINPPVFRAFDPQLPLCVNGVIYYPVVRAFDPQLPVYVNGIIYWPIY